MRTDSNLVQILVQIGLGVPEVGRSWGEMRAMLRHVEEGCWETLGRVRGGWGGSAGVGCGGGGSGGGGGDCGGVDGDDECDCERGPMTMTMMPTMMMVMQ